MEHVRKEEGRELETSQGAAAVGSSGTTVAPDNGEQVTAAPTEGGTEELTVPTAPLVEPGEGGGVITHHMCQQITPKRVLTQRKITCFLLDRGTMVISTQ